MKTFKIHVILCLVISFLFGLTPIYGWADVLIDGINYELNSSEQTAKVTYGGNYFGSIDIPSYIEYDGSHFNVTSIGNYAFSECRSLTSVTMGNNVISIGDYSFNQCSGLTSVTISTNLISIGECAFRDCNGLTSLTLPNSISSIGEYAFSGCNRLTSIAIPSNVTTISKYAFQDCISLESVSIPNGVTHIDRYSFKGCSGLISVVIPNSVINVDGMAFEYCSSLSSVTIGNNVTYIGEYAFYSTNSLKTLTIPKSVTYIGGQAFWYSGLTSLVVESAVPANTGLNAFSSIYSSCTLYVPIGSKSNYQNADDWSGFQNIIELEDESNEDILATGQCGDNLTYTIYEDMSMEITGTGPMWDFNSDTPMNSDFKGSINSVTIEEGCTAIGKYAFYNCSGLISVDIPNSVTSIGFFAFQNCSGLTSIYVDANNAIYDSRENCNAIIETSSNTLIAGCKNTVIPNSVTSIGVYAFSGCIGLTSIDIPSSVTYIGGFAFSGCTGLTSVGIPSSVTSIDLCAFQNCSSLTSVFVDANNATYDSRENCNAIIETSTNTLIAGCKNTVIPNSVTSIGESAFDQCTGLTSIDIPSSVTYIGVNAFNGCTGLTSVDIPNSVTYIGYTAFSGCLSLSSISVGMTTPIAIPGLVFYGVNKSACTLYVPAGSKSAYEHAEYWNEFENIVEIEGEGDKEVLATGQCGDNVTYTIYSDHSMVISGTGAMWDYDYSCITPDYKDLVQELTIEEGVTTIGWFAFAQFTGITSLTIPNSVTTIGKFSFGYCPNLTSVDFGSGVSFIGNYAFSDCSGLVSLSIPDNVTHIDEYAFISCSNVTSLTIGSGLRGIGTAAFAFGKKLSSIEVDERNNVYDSRENCNAIINSNNELVLGCKSSIIPESVTSIGSHAFDGCSDLTSINIPTSVTSIESCAFSDCTGLTSVNIPNSVTSIGYSAFYNCWGLTIVTIPNSVSSIDCNAFHDCSSLTSIIVGREEPAAIYDHGDGVGAFEFVDKSACTLYVPKGSKSAYENAEYWNEFENIVEMGETTSDDPIVFVDAEVKRICVENWDTSRDGELSYREAAAVTELGETFKGTNIEYFEELQYFTGLTTLSANAFQQCMSLVKVKIPVTITTIEHSAFENCYELNGINLHEGIVSIDWGAFYSCRKLTSITIPATTTNISNNPFDGCSILSEVSVADGNPVYDSRDNCNAVIETATNTLVIGCYNSIIPEGIVKLGNIAFAGCSLLTSISFPSTLRILESQVFIGCSSLTSIDLNNVTQIGGTCFTSPLTSVHIPASVSIMVSNPFDDYYGTIETITVDPDNPYYDSRDNCNAIISNNPNVNLRDGKFAIDVLVSSCKNTVIPNSVRAIGNDAFAWYKEKTIDIPEGVESILYGAFSFSEIETIKLPKSLTFLDECAFFYCTKLSSVTVQNEDPLPIDDSTFRNVNKSTCTLYVPKGSKSAYENAEYWNEFENIVEFDPVPDTDISALANAIYVEQVEGRIGGTKDISIRMKNSYPIRGFQFKLELPEGTTINGWSLSTDRLPSGTTISDKVGTQRIDGNTINVACSLTNTDATFTGSDGEIATINVTFGEDMEAGSYAIYLTECDVNDAAGTDEGLSDIKSTLILEDYVPGDANGDGLVRIGDTTTILNYIVGNASQNFQVKAADVNGDGLVRIGDVTAVLNIIVSQ